MPRDLAGKKWVVYQRDPVMLSRLNSYAAENKLPVYWLVNIPNRQVEVYTLPRGGKSPTYRGRAVYGPGQDVPVVLAGQTFGSIPVSELLP